MRRFRAAEIAKGAAALACGLGLLGLSGPAAGESASEPRLALIIANEEYPASVGALQNPHLDADTMEQALKKAGFSVVVLHDQDKGQIASAVSAFQEKLFKAGQNSVGFFYYSGHGASAEVSGERRNYLVPARAAISTGQQLAVMGTRLDQVVDDLSAAQAKAVFVVFDACRNTLALTDGGNGDKGIGGGDKGLVAVGRAPGLFIAFASADGQTTPDDGVFAKELAKELTAPQLTADRAFTLTNRAVSTTRKSGKVPFVSDGLRDDVCFMSCPSDVASAEAKAAGEFGVLKAALDSPSEKTFSTYLTAYPKGQYAALASRELDALRKAAIARPAVTGGTPTVTDPTAPLPVVASCPSLDYFVFFEWDRADLAAGAGEILDAVVAHSKSCNVASIAVTGHTDTSGSASYNFNLSKRMAQAVADGMVARGIPANLLTVVGAGETGLRVQTADGVREPQNRNVAIKVSFK